MATDPLARSFHTRKEAEMERSRVVNCLLLLACLVGLAGCQTIQSYNPLSDSHGLPRQSE